MTDRRLMKLLFISLGCDKNLVDSEEMLGILTSKQFEITDDETEADVIIINTCCFIHDAKEESIETILQMAQYRKSGNCKVLLVTGCLAQRYKQEIVDEIPEVDAVLGTTSFDTISTAIETALEGSNYLEFKDIDYLPTVDTKRVITTGGHFSYLKIAEGCEKNCTYCIIPKLRGKYRSIPMDRLIEQAEYLVSQGVSELIVIAQETTIYGVDLYEKKSLHILLEQLCKIEGLHWLRIQYCYPEEIYSELIETIAREDKICKYLDLPIQHSVDHVLKRMGRRTSRQQLISIIEELRDKIPGITLRTTLITGFPGETQEEHEELMEFVDEMEFERLGVFTYSPEEDTPAARMPDQVPEEIKKQRQAELMELQQEISFAHGEEKIGQVVEAFIEGKVADEPAYLARTQADAPNIDGYLFINTDQELLTGQYVMAKVTAALEYDLIGELVDEYAE